MKTRFLIQMAVLIVSLALILALALAALHRLSWMWFWTIAIIGLLFSWALNKKPAEKKSKR